MDEASKVNDGTERSDERTGSTVDETKEPSKHARVDSGAAENIPEATRDHIIATIYGQCMGDAIGLLSEFYGKEQAVQVRMIRSVRKRDIIAFYIYP